MSGFSRHQRLVRSTDDSEPTRKPVNNAPPKIQLPISRVQGILNKISSFYTEQEEGERAMKANQVIKKQPKTIVKKHVYMQHLEKKLNEITALGKEMRDFQATQQSQQKAKETAKQLQIETSIKSAVTSKKKTKICQQFLKTGLCRNKDSCKYAHAISDLSTEYFPQTWVGHFQKNHVMLSRPKSAANFQQFLGRAQSPQALHRVDSKVSVADHFKRPQTAILVGKHRPTPLARPTSSYQGNSVINLMNSQGLQAQMTRQNGKSKLGMNPTDNTNIITNLPLSPSDPSIDKIVNSKGRTLLMETVISGNMEGVRNLLQMGCNPNLTDWRGENSMILAIKKNFNEILGVILDSALHAIDLNCRFFTSKLTYLMMAARLGLSDIIKTLLAAKADPNITDESNKTAIFYSIMKNDLESIYDLAEGGTQLTIADDKKKTCVDYAYQKHEIELISYLFSKGGALADNTQHHKIMFFAVENNHLNLVYEMIKRGNSPLSVDEDGNNLMVLAIKHQHYDSAIELCEDYSLYQIIHQNNKYGENCIFLSIKEQAYQLAKFFIRNAKTLDCLDSEGKTPLIYAAESGQEDLVQLILDKEPQDINRQDKKLGTALIYAAKSENLLSVDHILTSKQVAKAYLTDFYGKKARHYCTNKAVKTIINHFMFDQGQLSESLLQDLQEEEDSLNKQVMQRITGGGSGGSAGAGDRSLQQQGNAAVAIPIGSISSRSQKDENTTEFKFKRVKIAQS